MRRIYRLPPLPPTLPALDDLMRCWLQGVVDGFLSAFFVDVDPAFFTFLKQPGSLFGALLGHFGRLWLPVATFQAHLAPESQKLGKCQKLTPKWEPFWLPLAALGTLGLHKGGRCTKNGAKSAPKWRFVDFMKMCVFRK